MANLQRLIIGGRPATIAFMTAYGGDLVEPANAAIAVATFADGGVAHYVVGTPTTAEDAGHPFHGNQWTSGTFGLPPSASDPAPGSSYMYHSTNAKNVPSIAKKGLVRPTKGIGDAPISLSPHLDSVHTWAGLIGNKDQETAVLRTKRAGLALEQHEPGEYDKRDVGAEDATFRPIAADRLEVYHEGQWKKLTPKTLIAPRNTDNTPIHVAADDHVDKVKVAVKYAFMQGRAAVDRVKLKEALKDRSEVGMHVAMDDAKAAVHAALLKALPPALLAVHNAGGHAGMAAVHERMPLSRAAGGGNPNHDAKGQFSASDTTAGITDQDWDLVSSYVTGPRVNEALNGGRELDDDDRRHLEALDKIIAAQPKISAGTELLRSVSKEDFDRILNDPSHVQGGFMSTSQSLDAVHEGIYQNDLENEGMGLLKVEVGEGVHGLDVNKTMPDDYNSFPSQEEVILDRGLTVTVLGKEKDTITKDPSGLWDDLKLPTLRIRVSKPDKKGRIGASGDWGHAGRPGEVGGSSSGGGAREASIKVLTVKEAIPLILAGKVVELKNPGKVNTLLTKLAAISKDAVKRGEKAPNYDACKIAVAGASFFCGDPVKTKEYPNGMPRVAMPQLGGVPRPGSAADKLPKDDKGAVDAAPEFLDYLERRGISSKSESVRAESLMASQAQMDGPKIAKRVAKEDWTSEKPVFISRDNYIIDGHHNWAAQVGRAATKSGDKLSELKIRAIRVDAPISEVLKLAKTWSVRQGLGAKSVAAEASLLDRVKALFGFRTAAPQRKGQPHSTVGPFGLAFNVSDPNAVAWAREHAAELAQGLSDTTEQDIRDAIASNLEGDIDQGDAYDEILDAIGDDDRAEMIARTETMTASNQGTLTSWDQATEAGLLTGDELKEWIATSGCCDECADLDGEQVALDADFSSGDDAPPAHPNCRCTIGMAVAGETGDEGGDDAG